MKKVAAYCRVSTDQDDQINSLENQQSYFFEYIQRNPDWELAEIYVDEGITGTSTKKRRSFNRMIADAQEHRFDLVLTKEISRFARNTLDSILYTRKLKELGIGVIFLNDNINTLEPDAELRLTIMSSIAQEESRKTSERVKWGQKRRMEQGVVFGRDLLGYDVRDGKLFVNEQGAEIVQLIFQKFLEEEKGCYVIARELENMGAPVSPGMKRWSGTAVLRILRNEKYCGDLIQKKTYTPSYLSHEKKPNTGQEELVSLSAHHQPLISRERFVQAQAELLRRSAKRTQQRKHSSRYCFSGKILCGGCGATFVSRTKNRKGGEVYQSWRCYRAVSHGAASPEGCPVSCISNCLLQEVLRDCVCQTGIDREGITEALIQILTKVAGSDGGEQKREQTLKRQQQAAMKKERLLELYLSGDLDGAEYRSRKARLEQESRPPEQTPEMGASSSGDRIARLTQTVRAITNGSLWADGFYRSLLKRIIIYPDHRIEVELNGLDFLWCYR